MPVTTAGAEGFSALRAEIISTIDWPNKTNGVFWAQVEVSGEFSVMVTTRLGFLSNHK